MKCEVNATELKAAVKAMLALQQHGKERTDEAAEGCLMTVSKKNDLILESASAGAYLKRRIKGKTLRPGSVGMPEAGMLLNFKLSGTVTIEADKKNLRIKSGRFKTDMATDGDVAEAISGSRPNSSDAKRLSVVPFGLLKEAVTTTTYPPAIKEESLQVQINVRRGKTRSRIEVSGLDQYSYGLFYATDTEIKAARSFSIILSSDLMKRVLGELDGEQVRIDHDPQNGLAKFTSEDFTFYHPTLDEDFIDISAAIDKKAVLDCWFETDRGRLMAAVDNVKGINKGKTEPLLVTMGFRKKSIRIEAEIGHRQAQDDIRPTESASPKDGQPIKVNELYFSNFLKLAPKEFPIRVELWNKRFVKMTSIGMGKGRRTEFMIAMSDE